MSPGLAKRIATAALLALGGCNSGGGAGGGDPGADTTPPSVPAAVSATPISATTIRVAWSASSDDRGMPAYRVYRNGSPYHDTMEASFDDTDLSASTRYCYSVLAYDPSWNQSALSDERCATTPANGATGQYALTVNRSGGGTGTVTSSPAGIACGSTCMALFAPGTTVTLTATAASGSTFAGWTGCNSQSGSTCTVTMSAGKTVTAAFAASLATLSVTKSGTGLGTVTSSPTGISCGSTCSASYVPGTAVTLTATPAAGSVFGSWTGCDGMSGATCTVTVSAARAVTAAFSPSPGGTVTLQAVASNCAFFSSGDSATASTVYPNCYPAVGINAYWSAWGSPGVVAAASLVKFNVSGLAGKTIDSARLALEVSQLPVGSDRRNFQIAAVATAWSPSTVTWNVIAASSFQYYTFSWQAFSYPTYTGQVYDIDLKATVQAWASGTYANNGITLQSTSYALPANQTSLDAYEFYPATLTVTYH